MTSMSDPTLSLSALVHKHDPLLSEIIQAIPFMPISLRKIFVDVCQVSLPITESLRLSRSCEAWFKENIAVLVPVQRRLLRKHIEYYSEYISTSTFRRSLIWVVCRCASELGPVESFDILSNGIKKEVLASQDLFSDHQLLDYSSMFGARHRMTGMTPHCPLTPAWVSTARRFGESIISQLGRWSHLVYPVVQRKKNTSQETARLLLLDGYPHKDDIREITTADLERHFYETGVKIQGAAEMRSAWKFNDLKARCYYCPGGNQYWDARYVRSIAVVFMDANPVTHTDRRSDPSTIYHMLEDTEDVVLWDLESFTTTLSELRYFLYWLCRYLEDSLYVQQHPLRLFDYRQGVIEAPIFELLDQYNKTVNEQAEFSIFRLIDDTLDSGTRYMQNSGMLGVPGNIGFSTTLHGLHTAAFCGDTKSVCVGDDAKGFTHEKESLKAHIRVLGKIHPDKFDELGVIADGDERHTWKFVKRPLMRDAYGLHRGYLYKLPIYPIVYGIVPENRTARDWDNMSDRIHKFVSMVGSFFWELFRYPQTDDMTETDFDAMIDMICHWYCKLKIPLNGAFPGHQVAGEVTLRMSVPPVTKYDPRQVDWSEELWDRRPQKYFSVPMRVMTQVAPPESPYLGERFLATSSMFLGAMEDIGCIQKGNMVVELLESTEDNRRRFLETFESSGSSLYEYVVVAPLPAYYEETRALSQYSKNRVVLLESLADQI